MTDQAWVTLLVGILVVVVAFNQWRVAHAKFKLDLFDKRFAYHMVVLQGLWKDVALEGWDDPEHSRLMQQGTFLFGVEVQRFVKRSYQARSDISKQYADRPPEERQEALNRYAFKAQFELHDLVKPYLSLGRWR